MGYGRGGGGSGFGGSGRGRGGGRSGGSGGRGGFRGFDHGPPSEVVELGFFTHACEDDIVCQTTVEKVPYFNAPVYFENKEQIGKIDEIFGGIKDTGFSVKLTNDIKASSFKEGVKLYIDPAKLLPIERFLPGARGRGRGGAGNRGNRGSRGGRDGGRGRGGFKGGGDRGRGNFRSGDRGGFRNGRNNSFRGGRNSFGSGYHDGSYKRSFGGSTGSTPQNKRTKFSD